MAGSLPEDTLQSLATLILASAVVMGSPGPSTMSALAVSAAFGFLRSMRYVSGLIVGTTTVLIGISAGVVAVLLSQPAVARVFVYASAAYILYLALQIARAPPLTEHASDVPAPSFFPGYILAVANPKAWFAIAAVFAGSTLVEGSRSSDGLAKVIVLAAMIVIIHVGWVLAGSSLARMLRDPVASRVANIVFAVILAVTAILPLLR